MTDWLRLAKPPGGTREQLNLKGFEKPVIAYRIPPGGARPFGQALAF